MIDKKDIEHIVNLSRISMDSKEKESLSQDLSDILGYVEKLKELDVSQVKTVDNLVVRSSMTRKDQPQKSCSRKEIIDLFTEKQDRFLKVKSIL
jgi:aspartyl-tRNA(Asn)/glutamyl-tRNA(Gln) amidotransferase subunit C